MIENWHRLNLDSLEAERFIYRLWEKGKESGRYKSIADMARKLGIPKLTLYNIIKAHEERIEYDIPAGTHQDIMETTPLRDEPELRKQVLELREEGKISWRELRQFSKIIKEHPELAEDKMKQPHERKQVSLLEAINSAGIPARLPSDKHPQIKKLAEKIGKYTSAGTIANRIRLLVL